MAENITLLHGASKEEKYQSLIPQIEALVAPEQNLMANLANISAALKEAMGFFWVGFYLVDSPEELVLGPFQGPVACTRIKKGKGVCGTAWHQEAPLVVPDVDVFPGHIACSTLSKSEIVVPWRTHGEIIGVLDVDSDRPDHFDTTDEIYLQKILALLP